MCECRNVNGANFVYFGMNLRELGEESNPDPEILAMVQYAKAVVSALGWRYCIAATETAFLTLSLGLQASCTVRLTWR